MKDIRIGSIIRQKVKESSMTITEFAERINLHRSSIYHLYKKETIDTERLKLISNVLDYDFISEIVLEQEAEQTPPTQTVFMTVEIDAETIQKCNLPDEFLLLVKKRK